MGAPIPVKSSLSSAGYFVGLSGCIAAGNRGDRRAHRRLWLSLFFTLTTAFLFFIAAGKGMYEPPLRGSYIPLPAAMNV